MNSQGFVSGCGRFMLAPVSHGPVAMTTDKTYSLEDPRRRRYLMHLLCSGAIATLPAGYAGAAWFGSSKKLAADKSVYRLKGTAFVNDNPASENSRIRAGDTVRTGPGSEFIFAVGGDSFLLRGDSEIVITGSNYFIDSMRVLTGRILSVFARREANRPLNLFASTATIGIRGSGVYLEAEPEQTYVCTCYGRITLASSLDPNDRESITSKNHDEPRYISNRPSNGSRIREAPVINHSNQELELLEAIVGREVPAGFGKQSYER